MMIPAIAWAILCVCGGVFLTVRRIRLRGQAELGTGEFRAVLLCLVAAAVIPLILVHGRLADSQEKTEVRQQLASRGYEPDAVMVSINQIDFVLGQCPWLVAEYDFDDAGVIHTRAIGTYRNYPFTRPEDLLKFEEFADCDNEDERSSD